MKIRMNTLWRVPVFHLISSWVGFYLTIYFGGRFFVVKSTDADGTIAVFLDVLQFAIFKGGLFLIVLLLGGLWAFRTMTKVEIATSASIVSAFFLAVTLMQLYLPNVPIGIGFELAPFQNWNSTLVALLLRVTNHFNLSVILANFAPFLFVPFGRNSIHLTK